MSRIAVLVATCVFIGYIPFAPGTFGSVPGLALGAVLQRGAPVDAKDENYGGTPLGWALYAWGNSPQPAEVRSTGSGGRYYEVVSLLIQVGARVDPQWYEEDEDRRRAATKVQCGRAAN